MKLLYRVIISLAILVVIPFISNCSGDEPDPGPGPGNSVVPSDPEFPDSYRTTILIYAVASNNLSYDLKNDMEEIYRGAFEIEDLNRDVAVLLYSVLPAEETASLARLVKEDDGFIFKTVKEYDRDLYSTDPKRIGKVIDDARQIAPAETNGIIFWSHGMGWTPSFSDHVVTASRVASSSQQQVAKPDLTGWYGQDTFNGKSDYCDINELASAIPDNHFDFIWFDCCYMSGIELLYQLRGKCRTLVAYPTEIMAEGMPYHKTFPLIAKVTPDLVGASRALATYFRDKNDPFTVMVADMDINKIERVADVSAKIIAERVSPSVPKLIKYSRFSAGPFFDFYQFMLSSLNSKAEDYEALKSEFSEALSELTIFKDASAFDFRGSEIPKDIYSGVSVHYPGHVVSDKEDYYTTLDWYKRVYPADK